MTKGIFGQKKHNIKTSMQESSYEWSEEYMLVFGCALMHINKIELWSYEEKTHIRYVSRGITRKKSFLNFAWIEKKKEKAKKFNKYYKKSLNKITLNKRYGLLIIDLITEIILTEDFEETIAN